MTGFSMKSLRHALQLVSLVTILSVACRSLPAATPAIPLNQPVAVTVQASPQQLGSTAAQSAAARPIFVEFYTTWCAPCKQMDPIIYRLEDEYGRRVDFKILDAAGAAPEKQKYHYVSQPQIVIVDARGQIVNTLYGFQGYDALKKELDGLLAAH